VAAIQLYLYITLKLKITNENGYLNYTGCSWV